nr:unnamed protein product [Spirometra erinaceieuropaei]
MEYAITTSIAVGDLAAYVCYIGKKASAQSAYKLGSKDSNGIRTELIEAHIAINLDGASVALNDLRNHYLWLQNVQVEDIECLKSENKFICHLSPDNLQIYWMVKIHWRLLS